jgi:hypothetical protein
MARQTSGGYGINRVSRPPLRGVDNATQPCLCGGHRSGRMKACCSHKFRPLYPMCSHTAPVQLVRCDMGRLMAKYGRKPPSRNMLEG